MQDRLNLLPIELSRRLTQLSVGDKAFERRKSLAYKSAFEVSFVFTDTHPLPKPSVSGPLPFHRIIFNGQGLDTADAKSFINAHEKNIKCLGLGPRVFRSDHFRVEEVMNNSDLKQLCVSTYVDGIERILPQLGILQGVACRSILFSFTYTFTYLCPGLLDLALESRVASTAAVQSCFANMHSLKILHIIEQHALGPNVQLPQTITTIPPNVERIQGVLIPAYDPTWVLGNGPEVRELEVMFEGMQEDSFDDFRSQCRRVVAAFPKLQEIEVRLAYESTPPQTVQKMNEQVVAKEFSHVICEVSNMY